VLGHQEDFVLGTSYLRSVLGEQIIVGCVIVIVLFFNLLILYYMRKWSGQALKRRMEADVSEQVSHYFALSNNDGDKSFDRNSSRANKTNN